MDNGFVEPQRLDLEYVLYHLESGDDPVLDGYEGIQRVYLFYIYSLIMVG